MRKTIITTCAAAIVCGSAMAKGGNPFLGKYTTPYGIPPFEQIKVEHYKPAFIKGMEEHKKEIDAIVNNKKTATFENTIAALDRSGELLNKVASVFYGQNSACTSDEMQAVSREISPLLSQHSDDITMNAALFKRVKYVYDHQSEEKLDKEQKKLLEETYKSFVRSGANLSADKQEQLRKLNQEISMLQLTFGQNMLAETNAFQLVIDNKDDLAGLPQNLIASSAEVAKERGPADDFRSRTRYCLPCQASRAGQRQAIHQHHRSRRSALLPRIQGLVYHDRTIRNLSFAYAQLCGVQGVKEV